MLQIFECFFSTTGLFVRHLGPVADHFLNSSLLKFLQILYYSLAYPFIISNSSTFIKYNVNIQFFSWWSCCCCCFYSSVGIIVIFIGVSVGGLVIAVLEYFVIIYLVLLLVSCWLFNIDFLDTIIGVLVGMIVLLLVSFKISSFLQIIIIPY